jgi:hypothetical protein
MTTPKASGRECITHHHACACREARVAKLVEALEFIASSVPIAPAVVVRAAIDEWRRAI